MVKKKKNVIGLAICSNSKDTPLCTHNFILYSTSMYESMVLYLFINLQVNQVFAVRPSTGKKCC